MKKLLFIGLIGLSTAFVSCDKHKEHYGTYTTTETRTYEGTMMAGDVDLSDQSYLLELSAENGDQIVLQNIYKEGTAIGAKIDGSLLTIGKQSLDGFLEIEGNGSIDQGVLHVDYKVITPDGNVVCVLDAQK